MTKFYCVGVANRAEDKTCDRITYINVNAIRHVEYLRPHDGSKPGVAILTMLDGSLLSLSDKSADDFMNAIQSNLFNVVPG